MADQAKHSTPSSPSHWVAVSAKESSRAPKVVNN